MRECARSLTGCAAHFVFVSNLRGKFMSPLYQSWVYGTVRHVAGGFFAFMAGKGIVTSAEADQTLLWLSGAVAMYLWSLYEKWRANRNTPSSRPPASTAFMFSLLILVTIGGAGACKKPQPLPNEDQAVYKQRLKAVYAGQTIVAVGGVDAGLRILVDNSALGKSTAANLGEVLRKSAITHKVVTERLEKGNDGGDTVKIIQNTIADIEQIEKDGAISLTEQQKAYFYSITGGAKTSLAALQALLGGPGKPEPDLATFKAQTNRARAQIAWIFDLSTLAFNTVNRMNQFTYFTTPGEAFAAAYSEQKTVLSGIEANINFYKTI